MSPFIHACTKEDAHILARAIQRSFQDVAERFGLTQENAPRHPSNCTADWVQKDMDRGVLYFALKDDARVVGCVALEVPNPDICYLERLAVLPEQRNRGFGKALVKHVFLEAKLLGVHYVNIGIIAEHTELKDWYKRIGFVEGESKGFPHLPFRVTFMSFEFD
jgi:GNAT superfamily N-acetyltransferase